MDTPSVCLDGKVIIENFAFKVWITTLWIVHFDEKRLHIVEVILFNYLHSMAEITVLRIEWTNPPKITQNQYDFIRERLSSNASYYQQFSVWNEINTYALETLVGGILITVGYFIESIEIAMLPGFFLAFIYGFILLIQLPRVILKRVKEIKYYKELEKEILDSEDYSKFIKKSIHPTIRQFFMATLLY